MNPSVTEIGHLIHELAHKFALQSVEDVWEFDAARGVRKMYADFDLKNYNTAYERHTQRLLLQYGFITTEEYVNWDQKQFENDNSL